MHTYRDELLKWQTSAALSAAEKNEIGAMSEEEKVLAFSAPMTFGTAGLRSTMSPGIGTMNRFTVAQATRGIAALIREAGGEERGAVIAYDCRNHSAEFAKVAACVLAGAGIRVYLFDALRPTPELSFAVRALHTLAGINITASHNPKEYNGYKAYWEDGAQIGPEQAKTVADTMEKFDVLDLSGMADFDAAVADGKITLLHEDFDEEYLAAVLKSAIAPELLAAAGEELKVVYTPLHGAGRRLVPEAAKRAGVHHLYLVEEQMTADGNFPTVVKPNPEYPAVFRLGIEIAERVGSDLVIATDPDSDRVGVMTRTKNGGFAPITGNQMGALLLDYAIRMRRKKGTLPKNAYAVKSIVSTDMAYRIAAVNGIRLYDVLTGFKYIGEVIKNHELRGEEDGFVLGFEESYGYLLGSYARDKDAVEATLLILEMTAYYRTRGMTLSDALEELYRTYGRYGEKMTDIYMEGATGIARRKQTMESLRNTPPAAFGGFAVRAIGDYLAGETVNLLTGERTPTGQPSSDVLYYTLENDDKIIVRPSGTEPKIKIYVLAHADEEETLAKKIAAYEKDVTALPGKIAGV